MTHKTSYKTLYTNTIVRIGELEKRIAELNAEKYKFRNELDYWIKMLDDHTLTYEKALELVGKLQKEITSKFSTTRFDDYVIMKLDDMKTDKKNWNDIFLDIIKEYEIFTMEADGVIQFFSENHLP